MRQMAQAVSSPTSNPVQNLARDSGDKLAALIQSVVGGDSSSDDKDK
jgi:hypothetical protein